MNKRLLLAVIAFATCGRCLAQNPPPPGPGGTGVVFYQSSAVGSPEMMDAKIGLFSMEVPGTGKVVTNAPYSATAVTEMTQSLSDGNRISNKITAQLARDSQGRTRREEITGAIGPWQVNGPKLVFINDSTSQTNVVLDPAKQSATMLKLSRRPGAAGAIAGMPPDAEFNVKTDFLQQRVPGGQTEETKTETLGVQIIEGVPAEGKRVTRTIPAGQIGNERPIEITSEVWYSPDLQVTVMSKHNDPRFGETAYRLTNIERIEPDHALFEVPPGYAVKTLPTAPPMPLPPPPPGY